MANRIEFNAKTRDQASQRANGRCEKCGGAFKRPEFDHILPLALGGKSELANCMVLCEPCHKEKTSKEDVPRIRKADRQRKANNGAKLPPAKPIQSAGFPKSDKRPSIEKRPLHELPRRRFYV